MLFDNKDKKCYNKIGELYYYEFITQRRRYCENTLKRYKKENEQDCLDKSRDYSGNTVLYYVFYDKP